MRMAVGRRGGHQQLVESPLFPFPRHRKGRDHQGHHQGQQSHDAGNDEPVGVEVLVVPGAHAQFHRRSGTAAPLGEGLVVVHDDGAQVIERQHGGVGVASVQDELQGGGAPLYQVGAEVRTDVQYGQHFLVVDKGRDLAVMVQEAHHLEMGRALDPAHQLAAFGAGILVPDRNRYMVEVETGGVAEHDELGDGRSDEHEAAAGVAHQDQELLERQGQYLSQHVHQSRRL